MSIPGPELSTKWSVISNMARAVKDVWYGKTHRKSFARSEEILEMPYLLEIQKKSYNWFLQKGLQEVFNDVDSITDTPSERQKSDPPHGGNRGAGRDGSGT